MIYDGRRGYVSGDLSQPTGTLLAMTKGPIKGRNWFTTTTNAKYDITISDGASGKVSLQGTNDTALRGSGLELVAVEKDVLPTESANWSDIQAETSTSASGSFSTEYQFIRLIVSDSGDGYVLNARVWWN